MIIFSKVLGNKGTVYDALRAGHGKMTIATDDMIRFSGTDRPVVVWNLTRKCNLKCGHCYIDATEAEGEEMSLEEYKGIIDDLARFRVPMLILSGGEPLIRKDFFDILRMINDAGIKSDISTNGTLITAEKAKLMAELGIRYVGVSMDAASPDLHDRFRGVKGAWQSALDGVRNARDAGMRTGFRITLTKDNYRELPALLDLALAERVERFCVYHLIPTGRGTAIIDKDLNKTEREWALSFLYEKAIELRDRNIEILTTDSPMDGVYILERLKRERPELYADARRILAIGSGCTIGTKVANIDQKGDVMPCHFSPEMIVGNVRERPFSEIWVDRPSPQLLELRSIPTRLQGKCGRCDYLDVCRGCRKRALYHSGLWEGEDPSCLYEPPEQA
jgi:Fe-coproporphyrin III synthase